MRQLILLLLLGFGFIAIAQDFQVTVINDGPSNDSQIRRIIISKRLPDITMGENKIVGRKIFHYPTYSVLVDSIIDTIFDASNASEKDIIACYFKPGRAIVCASAETFKEYNYGPLLLWHRFVWDGTSDMRRYEPRNKTINTWVSKYHQEKEEPDWWLIAGILSLVISILSILLINKRYLSDKAAPIPEKAKDKWGLISVLLIVVCIIDFFVFLSHQYLYWLALVLALIIWAVIAHKKQAPDKHE